MRTDLEPCGTAAGRRLRPRSARRRRQPAQAPVYAVYRSGIRQGFNPSKGVQVAHSCDAALCTTLGINQTTLRPTAPIHTSGLLTLACGDLDQQSGLKAILALEQMNNCSCCASHLLTPELDHNA